MALAGPLTVTEPLQLMTLACLTSLAKRPRVKTHSSSGGITISRVLVDRQACIMLLDRATNLGPARNREPPRAPSTIEVGPILFKKHIVESPHLP